MRVLAVYSLAGISSEPTRTEDNEALLLKYRGSRFPPVSREIDLVNDVYWPWGRGYKGK